MIQFTGNLDDFFDLVMPKIRNKIASITKKKKIELKYICQHCNQKNELDLAHKKGRELREIIKNVLESYKIKNNEYQIRDLRKLIEKVMKEHNPIENNFLFLCKKCHFKYDSQDKKPKKIYISKKVVKTRNIDKVNLLDHDGIAEILSENETQSWKYKFGYATIQNQKNITDLILKIRSHFSCIEEKRRLWYYFRRIDNGEKQFAGIICNKTSSWIKFRILPSNFDFKDKNIIEKSELFFQAKNESERQIKIIPENYGLIIKCLDYSYKISE